MKSTSLILFLASVALTRSYAQDPAPTSATDPSVTAAAPADAAVTKPKKPAKSNIGDKSFMGDPDPLDVLEPKKQNNLNSEASEPVFEEITDILDEKPKKKATEAKPAEELKPPEVVPLDAATPPPADATAQPSPNQEPPKPDILTDDFQTPAPEVTPTEPPVVVDVEKPSQAPATLPKKKAEKPKKADPITADLISGDDPDFKREERFNRLYKKYNINPTDETEWGGASTGRQSMNYEIQRGDTLSDVSSTLFGDPKFWPKVWALNSNSITNPHIIVPRQVLKFYPGTVEQPPAFNLTDGAVSPTAPATVGTPAEATPPGDGAALTPTPSEDSLSVAEGAGVAKAAEPKPDVLAAAESAELPANESKTKLLRKLPGTFSGDIIMKKPTQNINVDFSDLFHAVDKELFFYIPFQISKKDDQSVGEIISGADGRTMIPDFTECTVQLSQSAEPNAIFYASTKRTDEGFGNDTIIYENLGEIEIIAAVNPGENIYRARMRKAIGMVRVGAKLFPGSLPSFNIRQKTAGSVTKAKILGAAHDENSQVIGSNAFVVIEGGSNVGFVVGQEFAVLENQAARYGEERVIQNERKIGKVHIVQVTEDLSTAFVVTSETEIKPGDFVGQLPDSAIIR